MAEQTDDAILDEQTDDAVDTPTDAETSETTTDTETEAAEDAPAEDEVVVEKEPEPEPLQAQYLRLRADFDNFRKRVDRDKREWSLQANERLFDELLPVLDSFDLGLANAEQNNADGNQADEQLVAGFKQVHEQLIRAVGKFQLNPIDAIGEAFDPNQHEAINHMPSADQPADHVLFQTRRGYKLGEKLLRAAQVVVSSGPPEGDG